MRSHNSQVETQRNATAQKADAANHGEAPKGEAPKGDATKPDNANKPNDTKTQESAFHPGLFQKQIDDLKAEITTMRQQMDQGLQASVITDNTILKSVEQFYAIYKLGGAALNTGENEAKFKDTIAAARGSGSSEAPVAGKPGAGDSEDVDAGRQAGDVINPEAESGITQDPEAARGGNPVGGNVLTPENPVP